MASEPGAGRALALTAAGALIAVGGAWAMWTAMPGQPIAMVAPIALGAGLFLIGVARAVKPPRTGAEEE